MQQSIHEIFSIRIEFPYPSASPLGVVRLLPLLQYLESSNFPKPIRVQFSGKSKSRMRKRAIQSYVDPLLLGILNPEGTTGTYIDIFDPKKLIDDSHGPRLSIYQGSYRHTLTFMIPLDTIESLGIPQVNLLFQQFVEFFPDAYIARGGFLFYQGEFYHNRILSRNDFVFRGPYINIHRDTK
jgi:hypothetical protein